MKDEAQYRMVRLRIPLADRLKDAAHEQRTSMIQLLARIIEESLPKYERK